ncbi:MAG: ABC transporter permease [Armatimonadota bacterium]
MSTDSLQAGSLPAVAAAHRNQWQLAVRVFRRNRLATTGLVLLAALVAVAFAAPLVAQSSPVQTDLSQKLVPPRRSHPFGTDHFGRDMASRLLHGARVSLAVGLVVITISMTLGLPLGLLAGYYGGRADNVIMRMVDSLLTFPPILLAVAIMGSLGQELRNVMLALGLVYAPVFARLIRGSTLAVKEELYVSAAVAVGASSRRLLVRHILPNVLGPIVVQATVSFSQAILAEASLSFLGLGTQPPNPSWGRDLSEARRYLSDAPWLVVIPTLAIMTSVLSVNFIGDGLRDTLDPRTRLQR